MLLSLNRITGVPSSGLCTCWALRLELSAPWFARGLCLCLFFTACATDYAPHAVLTWCGCLLPASAHSSVNFIKIRTLSWFASAPQLLSRSVGYQMLPVEWELAHRGLSLGAAFSLLPNAFLTGFISCQRSFAFGSFLKDFSERGLFSASKITR